MRNIFCGWLLDSLKQPAVKKSGSVKTGALKKADGAGHSKALGTVEVEDVEVSY